MGGFLPPLTPYSDTEFWQIVPFPAILFCLLLKQLEVQPSLPLLGFFFFFALGEVA